MKKLVFALFLLTNIAFAGDLGTFSDGSKGVYRIHQSEDRVIVRNGAKTTVYDQRLPGTTFYSYFDRATGITHNIDILDASSVLLTNDQDCSMLLTKNNDCR